MKKKIVDKNDKLIVKIIIVINDCVVCDEVVEINVENIIASNFEKIIANNFTKNVIENIIKSTTNDCYNETKINFVAND